MTNDETLLRNQIKRTILISKDKKMLQLYNKVQEELKLRASLRGLIMEVAAEKPEASPHPSTGINYLRALIRNTNLLSTLRTYYKQITTDPSQRQSFRAHVVSWVKDTMDHLDTTEDAPGRMSLSEGIGVDITVGDVADTDRGELESMFIDSPDDYGSDQPEGDTEEEGRQEISGGDTTGRDAAEQAYNDIEENVTSYYGRLSDQGDQDMFEKYLIANLKLYFDKWEKELANVVNEPTNQEYEQAKTETGAEEGLPPPPPF